MIWWNRHNHLPRRQTEPCSSVSAVELSISVNAISICLSVSVCVCFNVPVYYNILSTLLAQKSLSKQTRLTKNAI